MMDALAGLEPGRELALAYTNLAALEEWEDAQAAIEWATRAGDLAERLGETEIALEARRHVDAWAYANGENAGALRLEQALELASRMGFESVVAGCWHSLIWAELRRRAYADLDRHLEAAIDYCDDHDFELTLRYLRMYQARAALDRARWSEATEAATLSLGEKGPSIVPSLQSLVVLALVRARQGDAGSSELLDRAAVLAEKQGQLHALAPVAAARAEIAWLEGRHEAVIAATDAVIAATDAALEIAVRQREWPAGEVARWRWRAGAREHIPGVTGRDAATIAEIGRSQRASGRSSAAPTRPRWRSAMPMMRTRAVAGWLNSS